MVQRTRVFIAAFLAVISVGFALLGMEAGAANSQGACFLDQLVGLPCECNKVLGNQDYCLKDAEECDRFKSKTACEDTNARYYGPCQKEPGKMLGSGTENLLLGDVACSGIYSEALCKWNSETGKCENGSVFAWNDCPGFKKVQVSCD